MEGRGGAGVDRLDVRIIRELTQGQSNAPARPGLLASYRKVARALGVSPGTVRNRVARMTRSGFLNGTTAYVNPNALGLGAAAWTIEVDPTLAKDEVIRKIARLEGVIFFENFRGSLLGLGFLYEGEAGRRRMRERIRRIARATPVLYSRVRFPPCTGPMTAAEGMTALAVMSVDGWTYAQLARRLNASVRTVKRRISRLARTGAMFTFPRMDYRKISGGVTAEMLVTYRDPSARGDAERRVLARLDEWLTFTGIWEEHSMYRLILPNVALAGDLAREVGRLPGVRSVRGELVDEVIDQFETMRPFVERLASNGRGRGVPRTAS